MNTSNRSIRALAVALAVLTVLSTVGGVASAAGSTTISVSPTDQELAPGETTTVSVVLDNADGGVGSGQIGVQLTDPSTVSITDISAGSDPGSVNSTLASDGSAASVYYAFDDTADTGGVTVMTVTLQAESAGSTDISVVSPADAGGADLDLYFSDEGGAGYSLSSVGSASIEVTETNQDPTASISGPSSAQVSEQISFDASGSSDDGSITSYEWDFDGDGTPDATGEQVTTTYDTADDYDVELTVTDDDGATDTATQTVSVSEAPDPASFQVSNLNVDSPVTQGDGASVTATVENAGDEEGTQTVALSVDGSQDDTESVTLNGGASQQVSFAVDTTGLSVGDHDVTLSTDDDSASTTFEVAADEPANQDPSAAFDATPADPTVGEDVTFDASASTDSDGSIESYEWDFDDDGTTDASGEQVTNAFAAADDYAVTLTVTDDDGATAETTQTVSVSAPEPPNQPPTADAGDDQTVAEGDSVALDATGSSDADGDGLSYDWTQTGGTDVTLSDASSATPSFAAPDVDADETLTFEVEVSDSEATDTDTVAVTVEDADEPDPPADGPSTAVSLSPESDLVAVGDSAEYDVVVDDADGGVGVYSMTVTVDDPSVASITDASLSNVDENLTDVEIAADGSSATMEAVLVDTDDSGSVSLGTVTVESAAEGTTDVSLDVSELGNESGTAYEVTAASGATLEASTLVVGDSVAPAQDPDGDGVYEDVNGDGSVDVLDVQTLFADRDGSVVQNSPDAFDFNGDGEFSLLDIQTLFAEETG